MYTPSKHSGMDQMIGALHNFRVPWLLNVHCFEPVVLVDSGKVSHDSKHTVHSGVLTVTPASMWTDRRRE